MCIPPSPLGGAPGSPRKWLFARVRRERAHTRQLPPRATPPSTAVLWGVRTAWQRLGGAARARMDSIAGEGGGRARTFTTRVVRAVVRGARRVSTTRVVRDRCVMEELMLVDRVACGRSFALGGWCECVWVLVLARVLGVELVLPWLESISNVPWKLLRELFTTFSTLPRTRLLRLKLTRSAWPRSA